MPIHTPCRWVTILLSVLALTYAMSTQVRTEPLRTAVTGRLVHGTSVSPRQGGGASIPKTVEPELAAACQRLTAKWRARFRSGGHAVEHAPFVLAGDVSEDTLHGIYFRTIEPAAAYLQLEFQLAAPQHPIGILIAASQDAYQRLIDSYHPGQQVSIYGFFDRSQRTMVVNWSAGSGTLLHELTHALLDADCPELPLWFHEGMASLHEAASLHTDQHRTWLVPEDNWRLAALRPSLINAPDWSVGNYLRKADFRGASEAHDYALARYVCLYLHEFKALAPFYTQWRTQLDSDPLGLNSLTARLPGRSLRDKNEAFRHWILQRKHPPGVPSQ